MSAFIIPNTVDLLPETVKLITFFNNLAAAMEYPNCEGNADRKRLLLEAERQLILWGKV